MRQRYSRYSVLGIANRKTKTSRKIQIKHSFSQKIAKRDRDISQSINAVRNERRKHFSTSQQKISCSWLYNIRTEYRIPNTEKRLGIMHFEKHKSLTLKNICFPSFSINDTSSKYQVPNNEKRLRIMQFERRKHCLTSQQKMYKYNFRKVG